MIDFSMSYHVLYGVKFFIDIEDISQA